MNIDKVFNHYRKLLASKHNAKYSKHNRVVIGSLIKEKRTHLFSYMKECCMYNDNKENLRRFYKANESKGRIPKFALYYKDYLKYFCKPMIKDLKVNKVLMRNMEKVAQDFYYNHYQKGGNEGSKGNNRKDPNPNRKKSTPRNCGDYNNGNLFFDKRVVNEIEKEKNGNYNECYRNNSKILKKSISNQNIISISKIIPNTSANINDSQSNDSLMKSLLLSLETKKPSHINYQPLSSITNISKPHPKHHKNPPSSLSKQKTSLKLSNNNTTPLSPPSIHKDQLSTHLKFNPSKKLKVHHHPNNSGNTTNSNTFHNQQQHQYHPHPQVVYQYQKYRFKSTDKTPIPPNITPSASKVTISSPKHSIHLLSVSPSSTQNVHQKIWSPSSKTKTSYQRFMLNKNGNVKRMVTSSTITNTLMQSSPTGIKVKSKTKMSFNNSKPYTRMQSFSLRNSIGIEENVGIVPNNYRIGNKGGYLYGSVTSIYKRNYNTTGKVENVKSNRIEASRTYNTLRLNHKTNNVVKYKQNE